ncbi:MAG: (d)CMP kinase, partial [Treponema sp.]|nr:(d)CMP kinase [Treponema sp.]
MVIAIDGPAGSGKSTIAQLLAEKLKARDGKGYTYINSGNLYRALCLGCLRKGIPIDDPERVLEYAKQANVEYENSNASEVFLDGENVDSQLHSDEIDRNVPTFSAIVPVRHIVNDLIRKIASDRNAVTEGRDMTTVVFPNAEYRFYLDASADARAMRRFEQGVSKLSLDEIRDAIRKRDEIDKNKAEGSLFLAPGVEYIDTSGLTVQQVYDKLIVRLLTEGS